MSTATQHIREGSTSVGSCRLDHIIDGIRYLAEYDQELADMIYEFGNERSEEQAYIFDEICDRLNEIAPDGLAFGSHDCDGADYGFWSVEA